MSHTIRHLLNGLLITALFLGTGYSGTAAQTLSSGSCADVYVIQANDWLSKISDKFLGNLQAFPAIVAATNQLHQTDPSFARISNPDQIEVGWKLCVPITPEAEALLSQRTAAPPVDEPPAAPAH